MEFRSLVPLVAIEISSRAGPPTPDRPNRVPDLTDDDKRALAALLTRAISDDRFPMLRVVCTPTDTIGG
jgi:hypothetical protein